MKKQRKFVLEKDINGTIHLEDRGHYSKKANIDYGRFGTPNNDGSKFDDFMESLK